MTYNSWNYRKNINEKKLKIAYWNIRKILIIVLVFMSIITLAYIGYIIGSDQFSLEGVLGGRGQEKTKYELELELQQHMEDNMLRVMVNQRPTMNIETGATSITVQNSIENIFAKRVEYYSDSGTLIYETPILYPGDNILSAVITGVWEEGEYPLLAKVMAVDMETQDEFEVTEIDIYLRVKYK